MPLFRVSRQPHRYETANFGPLSLDPPRPASERLAAVVIELQDIRDLVIAMEKRLGDLEADNLDAMSKKVRSLLVHSSEGGAQILAGTRPPPSCRRSSRGA